MKTVYVVKKGELIMISSEKTPENFDKVATKRGKNKNRNKKNKSVIQHTSTNKTSTAGTTSQSPKHDENINTENSPNISLGASGPKESDSTENLTPADQKTYPTLRYIAIAAIVIILCVAAIYSLGYMPTVLSTIYAAPQYISLSIFSGFNTVFMSLLYIKNLTLSIISSGVGTIYTLIGTALVSTAHAINYTYASLSYTAYVVAQCVKAYAYYIAAACVAIPLAIWVTNTLETQHGTRDPQTTDEKKPSTKSSTMSSAYSILYNICPFSIKKINSEEKPEENTKKDQEIIDYPCL